MLNHLVPRTLTVALVAAAVVVVPATAAQAVACPFTGPHTFHWTGGDGHWFQTSHWQEGSVPGKNHSTADTDYACINNGATVSLVNTPLAEEVGLAAIYVGSGSHVIIDHGRFLFLNGTSRPSIVRPGSDITNDSGSLGGTGTLDVFGTVHVAAPSGAPALATRKCAEFNTCTGAATGTLAIEHRGSLTVTGPTNFTDRYVIDNSGTVKLTGNGYIAGDWGTTIINRHVGHIVIANDRGLYEGKHPSGRHRPWLKNYGDLAKTNGTGTSVIGLTYIRENGSSIHVKSGTLVIGGSAVPTATVEPGRTYGTGACPSDTPCGQQTTNSAHVQTTTVAVPSTSPGSAKVTIAQTAPPSQFPNAVGQSVSVTTPGATATPVHPMRFTFSFLLSSTGGRLTSSNWRSVKLDRSDTNTFHQIPRCLANGKPRNNAKSCFDMRRTSNGHSLAGASYLSAGVVHLVVRTQQNSRWVVI